MSISETKDIADQSVKTSSYSHYFDCESTDISQYLNLLNIDDKSENCAHNIIAEVDYKNDSYSELGLDKIEIPLGFCEDYFYKSRLSNDSTTKALPLGKTERLAMYMVLFDTLEQLQIIRSVGYMQQSLASVLLGPLDHLQPSLCFNSGAKNKSHTVIYSNHNRVAPAFRFPPEKKKKDVEHNKAMLKKHIFKNKNKTANLSLAQYVIEMPDKTHQLIEDNDAYSLQMLYILSRVKDCLSNTTQELFHHGNVTNLEKFCHSEITEYERNRDLIISQIKNEMKAEEAKNKLALGKEELQIDTNTAANALEYLRHQWQEMRQQARVVTGYQKKRLADNLAQESSALVNLEKKLRTAIQDTTNNLQIERRIFGEQFSIMSDGLDRYNLWSQQELEKRNLQIENLTAEKACIERDLKQIRFDLSELHSVVAEEHEVVKCHHIHLEEMRIFNEQKAKQLVSAVVIQSWWRGHIVRYNVRLHKRKLKKKGKKKPK